MKPVFFVLTLAMSISMVACGPRKPAYNDINPDQSARNGNQNSSANATAPPDTGSSDGNNPAQAAAPPPKSFKMPEFVNQATGEIKDLPSYPRALRRNIQYGPVQDQEMMKDTMSLLLETGDPMAQIADFYDKTIKSNGWTIIDKLRDPELSQWSLKKGNDNEAKVEVRKDPKSNSMFIALARTQTQPKP